MSFWDFYQSFKATPLWSAMERTVENSPWHREASVAVHTQMLIDWYVDHYSDRGERQKILSLTSCLFHDVGKPPAEIVKFSEERGQYRAYHGHEQLSARLWMDYALTNVQHVQAELELSLADISNIALMIEYHVPFGLKDPRKRGALKKALIARLGEDGHQAWIDFLNCDQNGRISDDQPTKLAAVKQWLLEWETVT